MRACIVRPVAYHLLSPTTLTPTVSPQGRPFAWQEAHIALASIVQKFDIVLDDPSYTLELKQMLTIKPKNFYVHAIPRKRTTAPIAVAPTSTLVPLPQQSAPASVPAPSAEPAHRLNVVYGSNTGTSQTFAQRIASAGPAHGECRLDC